MVPMTQQNHLDLSNARRAFTEAENYYEIDDKNIQIVRGGRYYVINAHKDFDKIDHLIESLIFFKEFKAQLHHYLNLHRTI